MKLGEREILLTYGNFELAKQPYVNSGDAKDYIERVFSAFVPNLAFMEIDQMSMHACIHSRITPRNLVYAEEIHIVNGAEKHVPVTNIEVVFPLARKLHYGYDDVLERVGNLTNVGVPFGEAVLRVRSTMNV